jgi:hypothetical protein
LIINELETNPGRWARIGEFPRPSTAGAVKFRLAKTYTPPPLGTDRPADTDRLDVVYAVPEEQLDAC